MVAQKLYEGIELGSEGAVGLITYMRTDSIRVSDAALEEVRGFIGGTYGQAIPAGKSRTFTRSKKDAQDAHEAIRPTDVNRTPDSLANKLGPDRTKTLPADLAAIRRIADDARGLRSDDDRYQSRTIYVSFDRFGAEVRRFSEGLSGRPRRKTGRRRGRRRRDEICRWCSRAKR